MSDISPELHQTIHELHTHIVEHHTSRAWKTSVSELFVGIRPDTKSQNKLEGWDWNPAPEIFLLERYHDQEKGEHLLRAYPDFVVTGEEGLFVPSLIIGTQEKITRMSCRDGQPVAVLEKNTPIVIGDQELSSEWIFSAWQNHTGTDTETLYYYMRPCTFVLSGVIEPNTDTRIKVYDNLVQKHTLERMDEPPEWFAHISAHDESAAWLTSNFVHYLIALTNSSDYLQRHPEWEWYLVE